MKLVEFCFRCNFLSCLFVLLPLASSVFRFLDFFPDCLFDESHSAIFFKTHHGRKVKEFRFSLQLQRAAKFNVFFHRDCSGQFTLVSLPFFYVFLLSWNMVYKYKYFLLFLPDPFHMKLCKNTHFQSFSVVSSALAVLTGQRYSAALYVCPFCGARKW